MGEREGVKVRETYRDRNRDMGVMEKRWEGKDKRKSGREMVKREIKRWINFYITNVNVR